MIKSSLQKTIIPKKHNHSVERIVSNSTDHIDPFIDDEDVHGTIGIKSSTNSNDLNISILTDLDGLENEQSLLDDLLYGESTQNDHINKNKTHNVSSTNIKNKNHLYSRSPLDRSRSPSRTRTSELLNRSGSVGRSQTLIRSNDSDVGSCVSFNMTHSDVNVSENGKI